ncbi:hypothetical protein HDU67_010191, partial [Dinochytrium kinnereticum]
MKTFPASTAFKTAHVEQLKTIFDIYPFTDLAMGPFTKPYPLFQTRINIKSELDSLATNLRVSTEFEFYSRIRLLIASLQDGHMTYNPTCISPFTFRQPWHFAAVYPDAGSRRPVVRVVEELEGWVEVWEGTLGGRSPKDFVGWNVVSVDGVDAVTAIQNHADKLSGISRDPNTRFNNVLYGTQYINGQWTPIPGSFYSTDFLGHDASPSRTYVLAPPTGGPPVTITVPWIAYMPEQTFTSAAEYKQKFCEGPPPATARTSSSSLRVLQPDGATILVSQPNGLSRVMERVESGTELTRPLPDLTEAYRIAEDVLEGVLKGGGDARLDLGKPIVGDAHCAFYMLEDGETGVFVFPTVMPEGEFDVVVPKWLGMISGGLLALEAKGATKLVIDVTGNGGGYVCGMVAIVN